MKEEKLKILSGQLEGELFYDKTTRTLYATDASAYRELPLAVAYPRDSEDIKRLIDFATFEKVGLIPRTAGTSLAGQVVGSGIVVDVSKHFTQILEFNKEEKWVKVQPGVVRNELNQFLAPHGLLFGPETSTSNRAMIGGMVGNNSCGSNSVVYGSTRDHLLAVKAVLSDGSEVVFEDISLGEFESKISENLENSIERSVYKTIHEALSDADNQDEIKREFPKPNIPRRNTGYAIDLLLAQQPFNQAGRPFNFCTMLAGSEGTLAFITEIKLQLLDKPMGQEGLVCVHFNSVNDALRANLIALEFEPTACELMDHYILDCTKENREQRQNRFFVQGDPAAILAVGLLAENLSELEAKAKVLEAAMRKEGFGYHFPLLIGEDVKKAWALRKAGLGLLANIPGDEKAVAVIEDTAVDVEDLPQFIVDFNKILDTHGLYCVHYAHAGSGELHLRPIINLKTEEGNRQFRIIAEEIARLVKKYKGSLSGEHGDGRLRGAYIPWMIGEKNYDLLKKIKHSWDPNNIFNPNKIIDTPAMDTFLRYRPGQVTPTFDTVFDFTQNQGILRAAELCNGSGDCRKTHLSGGTMCPSYMATRNEKDTTRARANILREVLTNTDQKEAFSSEEIKEVMDLCLSCKGCKSECPSNVDVAKLKAEFLQQYYDKKGAPFRSKMIANFTKTSNFWSKMPGIFNFFASNKLTSPLVKKTMGFATQRPIPLLHNTTLRRWFKSQKSPAKKLDKGLVYFFCDEFTNFNDTDIGIKAIKLLWKLGYDVKIPEHQESARTYLSKGFVRKAKEIAQSNITQLSGLASENTPLVGLEPSAVLTFRDEYLDLAGDLKEKAQALAKNTMTLEEFLGAEIDKGKISSELFTTEEKTIKLHGHCHQKALSSLVPTKKMLSLPKNFTVQLIPSGCCGMAGSFGYEKEHHEVSMQVGELVLFPTVREQPEDVIIAAPGTSCRHQIKDGTGRKALHPVEVFYEALI